MGEYTWSNGCFYCGDFIDKFALATLSLLFLLLRLPPYIHTHIIRFNLQPACRSD
jgi:hypothetical protein